MRNLSSLQKLLDDGLDELAHAAHAGFPLRVAVNLASAGIFCLVLPWRLCVAWGCLTVALELQAWFATRDQFRGRPGGWRVRLWHVSGLAVSSLAWIGMGAMLWMSGSMAGALCAIMVWLSVIFFAQTNAYQSPLGFVVGGAIPGAAVAVFVVVAPHPAHMQLIPVLATLTLALCMCLDGASRMLKARRRLNETQAKLRQGEALYRVLADNATDVISLADVNGRRIYMSPSIVPALGYPLDVIERVPVYDFIHPDDRDELMVKIAGIADAGGQVTAQYRVVRADGASVWVETSFTLTGGDGGAEPQQIISVARNIQRRKELEAELIEARQAAEAAAAAKSDFLANMTHELRTPLNAIIGFSGLLEESRLEGRDGRYVRLIGEASATLLDLVNSVLDFSRLEAGAVELDPQPFDAAAEAGSIAELLGEAAHAKGLELTLNASGEDLLNGDAKRLRQVLLNFLSNAIKFTAKGSVSLTLSQRRLAGDAVRLRVEVADTGVGLAPDQIPHIFERFTQADVSVSRQYGGTGLGLAICKRVIDLMGGEIGVHSVEGQGSTFWFEVTLPRMEGAVAPEASKPVTELERPLRLLLVEDVEINRELVRAVLAPFDIEIETAEDGVAAVEAFRNGVFDLVLMDVQMPVMDGLTAARRIRALPLATAASTPIVAMTANVLPDQIARCADAGMDDHLGKPMQPGRLLEAISFWTSHERQAGRALRREVA